ncbi:MAG: protease complex subunit PrcB family protein [Candidatus Pacebacteria bacterium]|nr:protease complex subunit PrcB family protein [Candidatus Paceibacterota bacterium]
MRDLYLIGFIAVVAVALGTFLFFFGPSSLRSEVNQALVSTTGTNTVHYTVLAQGTKAVGVSARTNYRIQNTNDLEALWALVYGYNDTPAAPTVDFSQDEVIAVFDGSNPTTGYSINVSSITDSQGKRLVLINHDSPDQTCKVKNTATDPFEILVVPKTNLTLAHQDQMGTAPCTP